MAHLNYRRDIDGLRALAVLAVVVYHAAPAALPGGYIGVDIFFIISGFLITSILRKNLEAGSFSLLDFYQRRMKRIFPALLLVLQLKRITHNSIDLMHIIFSFCYVPRMLTHGLYY